MKFALGALIGFLVLSGCGRVEKVGPQGPAGAAGVAGANGADAASVRVVPLCPGVSNYGTFVEVALCIDDQLWAVYSANGGFLTLLSPGSYTSNAIGSACSLTVSAHCVVGAQ